MRRFAALAVGSLAALAACSNPSSGDWTGGPATPSPIPITANPSALPVGNTMPTGIVVDREELVLYFWGSAQRPVFTYAFRHTGTGQVDVEPRFPATGVYGSQQPGGFVETYQLVAGPGDLVEFGAVRVDASRITSQYGGTTVEARYARWSAAPGMTVFWLRRPGEPIPANTPAGEGRTEPLAPERYPLFTVYGLDGKVVVAERHRPQVSEQRPV